MEAPWSDRRREPAWHTSLRPRCGRTPPPRWAEKRQEGPERVLFLLPLIQGNGEETQPQSEHEIQGDVQLFPSRASQAFQMGNREFAPAPQTKRFAGHNAFTLRGVAVPVAMQKRRDGSGDPPKYGSAKMRTNKARRRASPPGREAFSMPAANASSGWSNSSRWKGVGTHGRTAWIGTATVLRRKAHRAPPLPHCFHTTCSRRGSQGGAPGDDGKRGRPTKAAPAMASLYCFVPVQGIFQGIGFL